MDTFYREFTDLEHNELMHNRYNGWTYSRKRDAFKARAKYICSHSKEQWLEMVSFFNYTCCNCESEVIGGIPTKDHIYPVSIGGTDSIRNIQPLCRQCNTSKFIGNIDYRILYCKRRNIFLPEKWSING